MEVRMLSGPDLGGGFLHQLSVEEVGEGTTFTFHAQDGGSDAGGPPKGPLDVFGFVHPPSPCMFGGPRCWHRRFLLPFSEAPRVRTAYNRNRFVMETMVGQAYGDLLVAVENGTLEVVRRLGPALAREGIEWYVGGSVAAWLLGAPIHPRDLDLGTTRAGVDQIAAVLQEYLIEPLAPTDRPGVAVGRGARAFVGTFREGIRAEWWVPLDPREPLPYEEWSGRPGIARLESVTFHGQSVSVSRPEYAVVRAAEKRRAATTNALVPWLRERGPDLGLLATLVGRSSLSPAERERLLDSLRA